MCIATCRRPEGLRRALLSLRDQEIDAAGVKVKVIVVDNDGAQQGRAAAERLAAALPFPLATAHAPEPGVSFPRNEAVRLAGDCTYLAFIDDDETATPGWLSELLRVARTTCADAVLGPVSRVFDTPAPGWLRATWDDPQLAEGATVPEGIFRTSNLLLRRQALDGLGQVGRPGPFDPAFALSGGSDYLLGQALKRRGARFVWAPRAVVHERVPAARAKLSWYLRRRFRTGLTYVRAQQDQRGQLPGSARGLYRAAGSAVSGSLALMGAVPRRDAAGCVSAAGLLSYAAGNLAGVAGRRYQEYGR